MNIIKKTKIKSYRITILLVILLCSSCRNYESSMLTNYPETFICIPIMHCSEQVTDSAVLVCVSYDSLLENLYIGRNDTLTSEQLAKKITGLLRNNYTFDISDIDNYSRLKEFNAISPIDSVLQLYQERGIQGLYDNYFVHIKESSGEFCSYLIQNKNIDGYPIIIDSWHTLYEEKSGDKQMPSQVLNFVIYLLYVNNIYLSYDSNMNIFLIESYSDMSKFTSIALSKKVEIR